MSKQTISERMKKYFDPKFPFEDLADLHEGLCSNAASFDAKQTRKRLLKDSSYVPANVWRFWFKPFDLRWAYIETNSNLWNRVRPALVTQAARGNQFLLVRRNAPKFPDGAAIYFSRHLSDQHALHTDAYFIPFEIEPFVTPKKNAKQTRLSLQPTSESFGRKLNLGIKARLYLSDLGIHNQGADSKDRSAIWLHSLAVGNTPQYLLENADGIRHDWPRIPLPNAQASLLSSAKLGGQLAALLDVENSVKGVSSGDVRTELKPIGTITRTGGGALKEEDLALTAGWGHSGKGDVTMPGKGKVVERTYSDAERNLILEGSKGLGLSENDVWTHLGANTCDVYLNDVAYWSNIPSGVWDYSIGGYQVIKKWLSYREESLLGRPLTADEVRYVQEMARRIAAILLLEPALDANYESIKANTFSWPPSPDPLADAKSS
jgi:hypothetical protein